MTLSTRQQEIKDEFIAKRATWGEAWEAILLVDPEFLKRYLDFSTVPWEKNHLDAKTKEFIYIAMDAAATHMYVPGIRQHIRAAFAAGATPEEVMAVLECTATLGIHAMNLGIPILTQVLAVNGERTGRAELTDHQERLKQEFVASRGYWAAMWDDVLELDPELFEAYTAFSSHPAKNGPLDAKTRELIYLAFDMAATHLYTVGGKAHLEGALASGATVEEIIEVFEIISVIGIHGVTTAAPILIEEARMAGFDISA